MECRHIMGLRTKFDEKRSLYCRLLLSSISRKIFDKIRAAPTFAKLEDDRSIPELLELARLMATGHGAASTYLDFLKLSELKCVGGDYMTCNRLYLERRRMIEVKMTTPRES